MVRFQDQIARVNAICQWAHCPNRVRLQDKQAAIQNLGPLLTIGAVQLHISCAELRNSNMIATEKQDRA
jgi:hypothetical protein